MDSADNFQIVRATARTNRARPQLNRDGEDHIPYLHDTEYGYKAADCQTRALERFRCLMHRIMMYC